MGVLSGLSINTLKYTNSATSLAGLLNGSTTPSWMNVSSTIAKLTGNYTILNLTTGITNLSKFLFRTPVWPIGGVYFDGILRTEHTSRVRPTQYPVQTGVTMTDHSIILPAQLTIEIMMTDTTNSSYYSTDTILDAFYQAVKAISYYSNIVTSKPASLATVGDGRSAKMWLTLKAMQQARIPMTVETRLQTYNNMIIEELSAPDDVKTYHALKCTLRLTEVIVASVAETTVSARAAATTKATTGGQTAASTSAVTKTAAKAIAKAVG